MPDEIGDGTAASIVDFLYGLGDAIGVGYDGQIIRYYQCQYSTPLNDREQLTLFLNWTSPSETPARSLDQTGAEREPLPVPVPVPSTS